MPTLEKEASRPANPRSAEYGGTSAIFDRNWSTAAGRFLPGRFYLVGSPSIPVDIPDWTKPGQGRLRIFESDFLESLTVVHPLVPLAVFLPQIAWLFLHGVRHGLGAASLCALFAAGLFFWTFAEYALHRLVFHFTPANRWQIVLAYFTHGVHHAYPDDDRRLVMPPVLSLTLSIPFYIGFRALLGNMFGPALAGFFVGYLGYDMTHYAVHALPMRSRWGNYIRKHHMLHHFSTPDRRYGVSTPLWDFVFGTHR